LLFQCGSRSWFLQKANTASSVDEAQLFD